MLDFFFQSCHKYTDVGLVSLVMSKLRSAHPPGSKVMSEYYSHILEDNYAKVCILFLEFLLYVVFR